MRPGAAAVPPSTEPTISSPHVFSGTNSLGPQPPSAAFSGGPSDPNTGGPFRSNMRPGAAAVPPSTEPTISSPHVFSGTNSLGPRPPSAAFSGGPSDPNTGGPFRSNMRPGAAAVPPSIPTVRFQPACFLWDYFPWDRGRPRPHTEMLRASNPRARCGSAPQPAIAHDLRFTWIYRQRDRRVGELLHSRARPAHSRETVPRDSDVRVGGRAVVLPARLGHSPVVDPRRGAISSARLKNRGPHRNRLRHSDSTRAAPAQHRGALATHPSVRLGARSLHPDWQMADRS